MGRQVASHRSVSLTLAEFTQQQQQLQMLPSAIDLQLAEDTHAAWPTIITHVTIRGVIIKTKMETGPAPSSKSSHILTSRHAAAVTSPAALRATASRPAGQPSPALGVALLLIPGLVHPCQPGPVAAAAECSSGLPRRVEWACVSVSARGRE